MTHLLRMGGSGALRAISRKVRGRAMGVSVSVGSSSRLRLYGTLPVSHISLYDVYWKLIWVGWSTIDSLNAYEKSTERALQREVQAEFSSSPLESHRCKVNKQFWAWITPHLGLIDAHFPSHISDEDKRIIGSIRGLRYLSRQSEPAPFDTRPSQGWLMETHKFEGQETVVIRFWNYWLHKDRELHRTIPGDGITPSQKIKHEEYRGVYNNFLEQLRIAGAVGVREYHLSGERLWDHYLISDAGTDDENEELFTP